MKVQPFLFELSC